MVDRRASLSLTEWAVLGLVVEHPRHGYDIATELRPGSAIGEVWTVGRPPVYRALDRLEALGLITARRQEAGRRGPTRRVMGPTARGRRALERWLAEPVRHLRDVRADLLLKLVIGERLGANPAPLLAQQRATLAGPLQAFAADVDPGVVARWRHHSAGAVDRFLADLEATPPTPAVRPARPAHPRSPMDPVQ